MTALGAERSSAMSTYTKVFLIAGILALSVVGIAANREAAPLTPAGAGNTASTGISAEALTTNTTDSLAIRGPFYNQLFLGVDITPTASGSVKATCELSPDGSNWYRVQDCLYSSAGNYNCSDWGNTFTVVSGTAIHAALLVPVYGQNARCTFTATTATGTITVRGEKSEQ